MLFLDRAHPRARAYIERARSAMAERQRESEEMLQQGIAAFERGDDREAKRLLSAAIAGGAPPDEATVLLNRIDRLAAAKAAADLLSDQNPRLALVDQPRPRWSGIRILTAVGALAAVATAGAVAAAVWDRLEPRSRLSDDAPAILAPRSPTTERCRSHAAARPRLRGLTLWPPAATCATRWRLSSNVRPTDAQKPDADRLRAEIQRELLNPGTVRRIP